MNTRVTLRGYSTDGKKTKVSLRLDEQGRLINPRSLARSSMVGWGKWQAQDFVRSRFGSAWYVTTAGHGGYLLVTQAKIPLFFEPSFCVVDNSRQAFVYEFEEDCDWAILELADHDVREWSRLRRNEHARNPISKEEYRVMVYETAKRYRPELTQTILNEVTT